MITAIAIGIFVLLVLLFVGLIWFFSKLADLAEKVDEERDV